MKNIEAASVLNSLLENSRYVIVSLPLDAETNPPPGTGALDWGNPFESHVGNWSHELFIDTIKTLGGEVIEQKRYKEIAVYLIKQRKQKENFKIVCICQIYNEIEKGNLKRFFEKTKPLVDAIIIYDDGSTDGSYEYSLTRTPFVIRSGKNDFKNELAHRQLMLEKALTLSPDYILWLDADEVLSEHANKELQNVCKECTDGNFDGASIKELNIWRSKTWRRIDSLYNIGWFNRLWKVVPGLSFDTTSPGLHQDLFPSAIKNILKTEKIFVLHYGFADMLNISCKYLTYRNHGQRGYDMLDRLISEEKLELEKIPRSFFPKDLWEENEERPIPLSFSESLANVDKFSDKVFRPKYSIACLVYKSVDWLKFVYDQVLKYTDLTDKEFYFIANDANEDVLNYLKNNHIPHYIFNNSEENKKEWYINNVYRAWNYAAKVAKGDFIVFINSDMAFTPGWLENLINSYDGSNCVASRLVESGKLKVGKNGIEKDFGRKISIYEEFNFLEYVQIISENKVINGGLYMPLFIRKDKFEQIGGYPEGNMLKGSESIFNPKIGKLGDDLVSGDTVLMQKLETIGVKHQTAFNSIVYHFQCGEMNEKENKQRFIEKTEIALCNDLVTGTMGEKVLWDYLLEGTPCSYGVDQRKLGKIHFSQKAENYILDKHPNTSIVIQNATFIDYICKDIYTIAFLQDDLRSMGRQSPQQELNLKLASKIVTNSYQTAASYREYPCEVIPVGVNPELFCPKNKSSLRKKHGFKEKTTGIFVGDFSEVKGWSKIKKCIEEYSEIQWILVTKKNEDYSNKNVRVYKRIEQGLLSELLNCADFFILGSPVETQCLAAIEACLCDIPIIMKNVGIFKDLVNEEKRKVGIIGDDFEYAIENITKNKYSPRETMLSQHITINDSIKKWNHLIEKVMLEINQNKKKNGQKVTKVFSDLRFKIEFIYRKKILKKILGKEELKLKETLSKIKPKELVVKYTLKFGSYVLRKLGILNKVKKLLGFEIKEK